MKILFAFENPLPSVEADAEVFLTTAKYLAPLTEQAWLHVPARDRADAEAAGASVAIAPVRAWAPLRPAALRHIFCGLTLPMRRAFREADLVYTRNLWVAWLAVMFGQRVAFDHYRPWPDQIPPLQLWLYRLICKRRFLINICHSDYTRRKYFALGIPITKLHCIHNGYEPERLDAPVPVQTAKQRLGIPGGRKTVVYTGRINHKKGLGLVIEAAKQLPQIEFILVGSRGEGPIEAVAKTLSNVRIVPWQAPEGLAAYIFAADMLLIPPSLQPLAEFGSTVLPLKLFLYMASGRPILAGRTPDVQELLKHGENAYLCPPDDLASLVAGIRLLAGDTALAARLSAAAREDSRDLTWAARAQKIVQILDQRLRQVPIRSGAWSEIQSRNWARQSGRWLVHFLRKGSWVLPPSAIAPPVVPAESE